MTRPLLVRTLAPAISRPRAEIVNTVLAAMWPFLRILMIIGFVWVFASLACYRFETHRTMPVAETAGLTTREAYRDASGHLILGKGAEVTEQAQAALTAAGHEEIKVFYNGMYANVNDAIWWGVVTLMTVGYGDKYPQTKEGRAVAIVLMFMSLTLLSSFSATFASIFVARRIQEAQRQRELDWSDHIIFCGWHEMAPRVLRALDAGSAGAPRQVALINEKTDESMELNMRGYENLTLRFFRGNFVREEDLKKVRLAEARSVIIVPDASDGGAPDDNRTIEATITIKDMAPEVKVFAFVLDPERVANLRRAQVDDVVVSNEHLPELLAGFVTKPGMPQAIRDLLAVADTTTEFAVEPIPDRFHERSVGELWPALKRESNRILLGLVTEEEGFGLEQSMKGGDPYILEFIKEAIADAGITTQATGSRTRVTLNPPDEHVVHAGDLALVVRNRRARTTA